MYIYIILIMSIIPGHLSKSLKPWLIDIKDHDLDINEINKDLNLLEGDILEAKRRVPRNAIANRGYLWDIPIPYVLEESLDMNAKGIILRAFEQYRLKSCIDYKPRESEEYYLSVRKDTGCFSYVGRITKGGQMVSIGAGCSQLGIVEHEFYHALGFWHEQARYDRDDYITVVWNNIAEVHYGNFRKIPARFSTTLNTPYDYLSVMHYTKNSFSENGEPTILTHLPEYEDMIGQRLELSSNDILKLNRLYKCGASVSFMEHCDFTSGNVCGMSHCAKGLGGGWRRMSDAVGGPSTDHTSLNKKGGYFMHASTVSGQEGDSAWLETKRMTPKRECHVQCFQFYYYHSGSQSDQLNIWIREFQDERDSTGHLRLMGQITGSPKSHWQLHHVPLNATKLFQVEFEVRKGGGNSTGGFSIDDINLSETECPHHVWHIANFENLLNTSDYNTYLYSPRKYSPEGYAYQVIVALRETFFGVYMRLVSGEYDDQLEWPCPWRQVTIELLDQTPHIQHRMSRQMSIATDPAEDQFDNPRKVGKLTNMNGEAVYVNPAMGYNTFISPKRFMLRDYLKGGTAIFLFAMQDISNLQYKGSLPCPKVLPTNFNTYPNSHDKVPCDVQLNNKKSKHQHISV